MAIFLELRGALLHAASGRVLRLGVVSGIVLGLVFVTAVMFWENFQFMHLKLARRDTAIASRVAENLRHSRDGLRLALDDADVFGGSTRGWSSWIVENSDFPADACKELKRIVDSGEQPERSLEALWLLWRIRGDTADLEALFKQATMPGPQVVAHTRARLASLTEDLDLRQRINVPASLPLEIKVDEFLGSVPARHVQVETLLVPEP